MRQTRRFSNELSLCKKRNVETTYEIRRGEWQDTPPAIFLWVRLRAQHVLALGIHRCVRVRKHAATHGTSSAFSCVEIRAMLDESIGDEKHHRARAQCKEGLRARLRERGKTAVELDEPCGCGSAMSLR